MSNGPCNGKGLTPVGVRLDDLGAIILADEGAFG
jgi:hypothetical protein